MQPVVVQPSATGPKTVQTVSGEEVQILPLGSGGEVGRSCVIASFKGKNVMFDCGVHPAKNGLDALPLFDHFDMQKVDILLITHFHLDHCAALPYLLTQTNFQGKVFMTSATKAFYRHVMQDFTRTGSVGASDIVTGEWIMATYDRIETIEYHQEKSWSGIRFSAFNAGHVLGAAMFMVDIAGVKILYTGDFSMVDDRHLMGAEIPPISPDVVIVESTYGQLVLESREEREGRFIRAVTDIVRRGGRCLIPVFALGRAQELLLILEELWETEKDLQHIKIYYASNLAHKCMKLYQTYVHSMNERVKRRQEWTSTNPFVFRYVFPLLSMSEFDDSGPSVVIAAPGMLQNGVSLDLFEKWAPDKKNGIIFAGYCVEGTLAWTVQRKPHEVLIAAKDKLVPVRMGTIETISFSAHSDARQTQNFLSALRDVSAVVLVHGNPEAIEKLRDFLTRTFRATRELTVYPSRNAELIRVPFATHRTAKVMGALATSTTQLSTLPSDSGANRYVPDGQRVNGILLVSRDHQHIIVHPDDVGVFTGLDLASVTQAMVLPLPTFRSVHDILSLLRSYFAGSDTYNALEVAEVRGAASPGTAIGQASSDDEEVIFVGRGIAAAMGPQTEESGGAALPTEPKGVMVKLRVDPVTRHSVVTIVWKTSRLTDLIADVVCITLCNASVNAAERLDVDGEDTASPDSTVRGDLNPLPIGVGDSIDRVFKLKCFHHALTQFFPNVTTNLGTGECAVVANDGERVVIKNCIDIRSPDDDGNEPDSPELVNGVTRTNFNAVATVLRRVYLTLFPIPADFGWCDCGEQHGEAHAIYHELKA